MTYKSFIISWFDQMQCPFYLSSVLLNYIFSLKRFWKFSENIMKYEGLFMENEARSSKLFLTSG